MAAAAKLIIVGGGLFAPLIALHGCGQRPAPPAPPGPPGPPAPAPATTTTTTTVPHRTPGRNPETLAKEMNALYYGYDDKDPGSAIGVTMHLPSDTTSFYRNIWCHEYSNPILEKPTGCRDGRCDCRLSAALYNHRMLITEGNTVMDILGRRTAFIFNQTLVENYLSRCYFAWDGATNNKMNVGCGIGGPADCNDPHSAYNNICPSTGKICTADATESKKGLCAAYGGETPPPVAHSKGFQCGFPGPAIDYHGQDGWKANTAGNAFREMINFRVNNQDGYDTDGARKVLKTKMWNEVVLDLRLLMPKIWEDPAIAVPAMVYWKGDPVARQNAIKMRDEFCRLNKLDAKIPVLALDWHAVTLKKEDIFVAMAEDNVLEEELAIL